MQTIPRQRKERKFQRLQRRGSRLTRRIQAAQHNGNALQVEQLFFVKAKLVARLRELSRV